MKNPDQPIEVTVEVTVEDMRDHFLTNGTHFTTSSTSATVLVGSDEDGSGVVQITIDDQFMTRKDIKELRAFLKCLLADMKSEEA